MVKIKSFSQNNVKIMKRVIQFFYYLFIGAGSLSLLSFFVFIFIPGRLLELSGIEINDTHFDLGDIIIYKVHQINVDVISLKAIILTITISAAITLGLLVLILNQLIEIFKTLEIKNPFDEKNSKRVATIGVLLIISSFVANGLIALVYYMVMKELNITDIEVKYSVDGGLLLSGILVMLLSSIFKYGTFLQNEYNQTV